MIPRYEPNINIRAWLRFLFAGSDQDAELAESLIELLIGNDLPLNPYSFESGRVSLYIYLKDLRQRVSRNTVLLQAQVCPVVAHVVKLAGFDIQFVDADTAYPTPSPEQFERAIDHDTASVILTPLYGYLQPSWNYKPEWIKDTMLVLDLAQGVSFGRQMDFLIKSSDAVIYSFNLGKGLDTGGGLAFTKEPLAISGFGKSGKLSQFPSLAKALALKFVITTRIYPFFVGFIEDAIETNKEALSFATKPISLVQSDIYPLWTAHLRKFQSDVKSAGERSEELGNMEIISRNFRDVKDYCNRNMICLRQIIRLKNPATRDKMILRLKSEGIDCATGGEPLPNEYLDKNIKERFPNAEAFRADSIRLPFLGRLSDSQFEKFRVSLEKAIV